MAITDKKVGPWGLDQVYNKINQGSIWTYQEPSTLWAWGTNNYGQSGDNTTIERSSPVQVSALTTWTFPNGATGAGGGMFAINESNELWAWGNNNHGQLGQGSAGTPDRYSSPVQVGSGTDWSVVSNSYGESVMAIKTDGTMWGWGNGQYGSLAQGSAAKDSFSSPIQIPGTTWRNVCGSVSGSFHWLATKTDGTMWGWGYNDSGSLGNNENTNYKSSPVQVPGTDWAEGQNKLAAAMQTSAAIRTDGTLWTFGRNDFGMLGQNAGTPAMRSSPIQIPGTTWDSVAGHNHAFLARKTDGTIWAWGRNHYGELGQNSVVDYSSPVQIPGTDWMSIETHGAYNAGFFMIKTDNTLWAMGRSDQGGLGINENNGHRSSPVQIPGSWNKVTAKVYGALALRQA